MSTQIQELRQEFEERYWNDPVFSALCKLASRVLDELEDMGALKGNKSFAGFILVAAQEKACDTLNPQP